MQEVAMSLRSSPVAWVLLLTSLLPGCAAQTRTSGVKPAWIPTPNRSDPEYLFVTGTCRRVRQPALARQCAINDARTQVRESLRRPSLEVRGSHVRDEYSEEGLDGLLEFWVLVAYPRKEAARLPPPRPLPPGLSAEEKALVERWRTLSPKSRKALKTMMEQLSSEGSQ
jgi:hypothetical protein